MLTMFLETTFHLVLSRTCCTAGTGRALMDSVDFEPYDIVDHNITSVYY